MHWQMQLQDALPHSQDPKDKKTIKKILEDFKKQDEDFMGKEQGEQGERDSRDAKLKTSLDAPNIKRVRRVP